MSLRLPLRHSSLVANNPRTRASLVIPAGKHDISPRALADLPRALLCGREARYRGTGATPRSSRIGRSLRLGLAVPDIFVTVALAKTSRHTLAASPAGPTRPRAR